LFCQIVKRILKLEVEAEWRDSADCTSVNLETELRKIRIVLILQGCNSYCSYYYILDSERRYTKEDEKF
jgi:hypothetical protein